MPTTPAVKASTTEKSKKVDPASSQLMQAIAIAMQAGQTGRSNLDKISTKLQGQEKARHEKDMKRRK